MLDRVNPTVRQFKKSGIRKFSEAAQSMPNVVSLTLGEPEFDTDSSIKEALQQALKDNLTHYPIGQGRDDLRAAISVYEAAHHQQKYLASEIIVTVGSTQALAATFLALLSPGDEVIIPEPMYVSYRPMVEVCQAKLIPLDITQDNFQINPEKLEALITEKTKLIVITSPNNPTGVVLNQASMESIRDVVLKYRLFVISDDVYHQLVYLESFPRLSDYPELRAHLIIAQSFSKPYAMTGWRIGYIMADQVIANVILTLHAYLVSGIAPFIQKAAQQALSVDTSWMRENYRQRRDSSLVQLDAMNLPYIRPEGAFYIFAKISEFKMDSETFCLKALNDYGVAIVPGVYFGPSADAYIRLSYSVSEADLKEGLIRLGQMIKDLRNA